MSDLAFLPSQVLLGVPPLVATMGRMEAEAAAAVIVRACQVRGDRWQPLHLKDLGEVLSADLDARVEPWASLNRNPFFRPDFRDLVQRGFAASTFEKGAPIELTPAGIAKLARWVRP